MNTSDNIDEFILALRDLNEIIGKRAKLNLLDNAVLAESFYKEILNKLFSWELKNINIAQSNFEAIDLIDKSNNILVQVSCTCENQKIHSTISKKELSKEDYKGFELYFVFVGKQNSNVKKGKYNCIPQLSFNPNTNILLTDDLIKYYQDLNPNTQDKILDIVRSYLTKENKVNNSISKMEISEMILEILDENSQIFYKYGPKSDVALNSPMSEASFKIWCESKMKIIGNNKKILNIYQQHKLLFSREEKLLFHKFELNVKSFEQNNEDRLDSSAYEPFPEEFPKMLEKIVSNQGVK